MELNLPTYSFKIKESEDKHLIFDEFRKKYVALTPEEWVRQNFTKYLVAEKGFPRSLIIIEKGLKLNNLQKRADILIYHNNQPLVLVECKAPSVKISQATFDQISRYNIVFKVPFLIVTNGINHFACWVDFNERNVSFLEGIPNYKELTKSF